MTTTMPPHQFLIQRRVEYAKALLVETGAPVDAVGRRVGFRSTSHFTATFRRVVGLTPSRYRILANSAPEASSTEAWAATAGGHAGVYAPGSKGTARTAGISASLNEVRRAGSLRR
jgi:hypothetical protein